MLELNDLSDDEKHLALIWIRSYNKRVFNLAMEYVRSTRRPVEPQGIGAVVANALGHKFVRVADPADGLAHGSQWQRVGGDINALRNFGWSHIGAVEVLSEGLS